MVYVLAFLALGLLIGNLVGMTSASVVSSLIPLLFAFGGGSAIAFLQKLDSEAQKRASIAIASLSIACLLGVFSGIFITEHQLLSPKDGRTPYASRVEKTYLRAAEISVINYIDQQYIDGKITPKEAYEQLKDAITDTGEKKP